MHELRGLEVLKFSLQLVHRCDNIMKPTSEQFCASQDHMETASGWSLVNARLCYLAFSIPLRGLARMSSLLDSLVLSSQRLPRRVHTQNSFVSVFYFRLLLTHVLIYRRLSEQCCTEVIDCELVVWCNSGLSVFWKSFLPLTLYLNFRAHSIAWSWTFVVQQCSSLLT